MARLHHAQIQTIAGKFKAEENIQRNSRASDRHAFENALKVANSEKPEKVDSAIDSPNISGHFLISDDKDDWLRYTNSTVTANAYQSVQHADPTQAHSELVLENRTHHVRDFFDNDRSESTICAKRLDEVNDWLDEMLNREGETAGGWTFEFETDDAQLVELQLICQQDGQWSACINLDTTIDDQQELELMLSKKGVALSRTNIS